MRESNCRSGPPGPIRSMRCSPGTTRSAAICRGASRRAGAPTPTASGSARSCCSRPPSKPSSPFTCASSSCWPTVEALAAADLDDVLAVWAGLGYYSRARNLHKCAQTVAASSAAVSPKARPSCSSCRASGPTRRRPSRRLPSAQPVTPVDGNVERVVARLFAVRQPLPAAKGELKRLAATLTPKRRPGDFAQAMMDLGARICTPRRPSCLVCPVQQDCAANARGIAGDAAAARRQGRAAAARRHRVRRVARGRPCAAAAPARGGAAGRHAGGAVDRRGQDLLPPAKNALRAAPVKADWWPVPGHGRAHFHPLQAGARRLSRARAADATLTFWAEPDRCRWVARRNLSTAALPSVMRKVIAHGLKER